MFHLGPYTYAGTMNSSGCEVWRTTGAGVLPTWVPVVGGGAAVGNGFGDSNNRVAASMAAYRNDLYVGTRNDVDGSEVWRLFVDEWGAADSTGFGDTNNTWVYSLAVFNDNLYAGTYRSLGCQVWRLYGRYIPAVSTWGLAVLTLLIAVTATLALRRRQAAALE